MKTPLILFILISVTSSAFAREKCQIAATAKINSIIELANKRKITNSEYESLLSDAYEEECTQLMVCLDKGFTGGITLEVLDRVQLTWESRYADRISKLDRELQYTGEEDPELILKIENVKLECAQGHERLRRLRKRLERRRPDAGWDTELERNISEAMGYSG